MGSNNFVALPLIPAGLAQPAESAVIDLYAVVPPNGFAVSGISVILGGDFEGAIAIVGSLDGVQYRPVTLGFTAGKQTDPSRPRSIEFPPQLITDLIRYIKWKVLPNTRTFTPISITLGGSLNCDCTGGSGFPGYGVAVLPVAATNVVGVSPLVSRADHQHEGVHSAIAGSGISVSSATGDVTISANFSAGAPSQIDIGDAGSAGVAVTVSRSDHQHAMPAPTVINGVGSTSSLGASTVVAREDHTHSGVSSIDPNSTGAKTGSLTFTGPGVTSTGPTTIDFNSATIATWPLANVRYYAVDGSAGNDANAGYSDVSMSAAGAVAVRTVSRLLAVIPKNGAGRKIYIAIKTGTYVDSLNFNELVNYLITCRGTDDFTDNATDRIKAGATIALAGPNGDSSFTVAAGATTSVFSISAGALTAEPALIQKRIRFTPTTTTVALRNTVSPISANTGVQITCGGGLGTAPSATDTFWIEEPGVIVPSIICESPQRLGLPFQQGATAGVPDNILSSSQIVGIATNTTAAVSSSFAISVAGGNTRLSFCATNGENSAANILSVLFKDCFSIFLNRAWNEPVTGTLIQSGAGLRTNGIPQFFNIVLLNSNACGFMNSAGDVLMYNIKMFSVGGQGSYFARGASIFGCGSDNVQDGTANFPINSFGKYLPTLEPTRTRFAQVLAITNSRVRVQGVAFAVIGNNAITSSGGNHIDLCDCTGSPNQVLSIIGTSVSPSVFTFDSDNTIAGTNCDIRYGALNINQNIADFVSASTPNRYIDIFGNSLGSFKNQANVGSINHSIPVRNTSGSSMAVGLAVRVTGAGPVVSLAQADTASNAAFAGILVSRAGTTAGASGNDTVNAVARGTVWAQFDGAPTLNAVAYLSPGTAGNLTTTVPLKNATNQKVVIGRVIATAGTFGLVELTPQIEPVIADGVAERGAVTYGGNLASAVNLTVPNTGYLFTITGVANITYINASNIGNGVPIQFYLPAAFTVVNGGGAPPANHLPIKLAGGAALITGTGGILTLVSDGVNFNQVGAFANI